MLRSLAAALAGEQAGVVLAGGATPAAHRLVTEMIARGSTLFTAPACVICRRTGRPYRMPTPACTICGRRRECARCSLRQRTAALIRDPAGPDTFGVPAALHGVVEAITAAVSTLRR